MSRGWSSSIRPRTTRKRQEKEILGKNKLIDSNFLPSQCWLGTKQCCARVSPGTREPDPWEKIHQNRTRNRQKIKVSSRTGTGTAERCVSVLKPEKALKGQHPPHEINEFFGVFIRRKQVNNRSITGIWTDTRTKNWNQEKNSNKTGPEPEVNLNKF